MDGRIDEAAEKRIDRRLVVGNGRQERLSRRHEGRALGRLDRLRGCGLIGEWQGLRRRDLRAGLAEVVQHRRLQPPPPSRPASAAKSGNASCPAYSPTASRCRVSAT